MTTRRDLVASLIGAAVLVSPAGVWAQAPAIGDIRIDLSALRAGGWVGRPASVIESSLRQALGAAFGPRAGGGATLIVRVTSVTLGTDSGSAGGNGGRRLSEGTTDYMEGELILVGRGNSIISRQPLMNSLNAGGGGASWWSEASELRRLDALASSYGYWARRQLG